MKRSIHDLPCLFLLLVIVGDTAEGKEIRITLKTLTASTTEIMIRIVGVRDRGKLEKIQETIIERL